MPSDQQSIWTKAGIPSAGRLALLSSVAAIAIAVLMTGPGEYRRVSLASSPAVAAETSVPQNGFADVVARVKPAVIGIQVKIEQGASASASQNGLPVEPGSPLDKFLREYGFPGVPNAMPQRRQMITGEGSGFLISSDGYAVTNYHVVDHAKTVQVTTDDGAKHTAKVVGTDQKTDLALIKVDGGNFPYVQFATHEARVGDWVIAVGNPFGLGGTVTAGIVSARGRDIGAGPYDDYIQIDAPINKGNSGGPAFNTNGEVIGINTAIYSPSGGSVGIGFDIPAETAKIVVGQLRENGHVTRGWIGVQVQPVTPDIADSLGMKTAEGALVAEPQAGSPAARAGIQAGDVITAVNDTPIKGSRELARTVASFAPGTTIQVKVLRKGEQKTLSLNVARFPDEQQAKAPAERPGMSESEGGRLGLALAPASEVVGAGSKGVAVTAVDPDGPAAEKGVQAGDIILDVAGKIVSSASDVQQALQEVRKQGRHDVLLRVKSGDTIKYVAVPIGHV